MQRTMTSKLIFHRIVIFFVLLGFIGPSVDGNIRILTKPTGAMMMSLTRNVNRVSDPHSSLNEKEMPKRSLKKKAASSRQLPRTDELQLLQTTEGGAANNTSRDPVCRLLDSFFFPKHFKLT